MVNYFDIFVLGITLGLSISGFFEGFVRGVIKLAGFIAAIIFLWLFSDIIIELAVDSLNLPVKIAIPIMLILVFIGSAALFYVLAEIIHKIITLTPVKFLDSGLGSLFGLLKAVCLAGVFAMMLSYTSPGTFLHNQYRMSQTAGPLIGFLNTAIPMIKSAIIPVYEKYAPLLPEREEKEEETNDLPNVI